MGENWEEWLDFVGDEDGGHMGAMFAEVVDDYFLALGVDA